MAYCEKCSKGGYIPGTMYIEKSANRFVGSCCVVPGSLDFVPVSGYQGPTVVNLLEHNEGLEYGIKASNKGGVQAYVNYGGLQISFDRSAEDIRRWAVQQGLVTEQKKVG